MRVLFSFAGGFGHANPMVPLARACIDAGHVVAFCGRASATEILAREGFEVFTDPGEGGGASGEITPLVEIDMEHEYEVLRSYFAGRLARQRVRIVSDVLATWRPDVVVCDEVDYGGMIASELGGLHHATVLVTVSSFARAARIAEPVNSLRAMNDLPLDDGLEMPGRDLVLSPFPPSLRDLAEERGRQVMAFRDARVRDRGRPTGPVYFTLGTEFNTESGDLFHRVLAGLREADVEAVVTVGRDLDPSRFGPQPERIRIERFVSQAEILPRSSLAIHHGGSGSTLGALAHGLPMIVIPLGADQLPTAERCEELGVAIVLDALRLTPKDIRVSVVRALEDTSYRRRAVALGDEIAALPPAELAVREIEALQPA